MLETKSSPVTHLHALCPPVSSIASSPLHGAISVNSPSSIHPDMLWDCLMAWRMDSICIAKSFAQQRHVSLCQVCSPFPSAYLHLVFYSEIYLHQPVNSLHHWQVLVAKATRSPLIQLSTIPTISIYVLVYSSPYILPRIQLPAW